MWIKSENLLVFDLQVIHGESNRMWPRTLIAQLVKKLPAVQENRLDSWVRKIRWRRDRLPTPVFLGFLGGSAGKESTCNAGELGSIPGLGRSLGEGNGYPLQYSGLENSMDCIVRGVAKSRTQLSDFHFSLSGSWVGLVAWPFTNAHAAPFLCQLLGSMLESKNELLLLINQLS